ncbi:MAG TPA: L-threonylcarbamoyladenylate synthase [Bacteroidia bacterium]|nr:L-threonylcarbamoyladenylate synthase [Bacteroidia bacterium]
METIIGSDISYATAILRKGRLVAIPTETVYGLAGNALDENAVMQIFNTKNRPEFDPLIVHVSGIAEVEKYVEEIPAAARLLMEKFWPGPLTILLKKKSIIPDLVTSGLDTVAVRMPDHPLTLELLKALDFPLAAPSANPFGYISPTTAQHVADQLGGKLEYILDGGPCDVGIESTIVGFENEKLVVYRLGGTTVNEISAVVGEVLVAPNSTSNPKAPGMLKSHYAPSKPLYFGNLKELMKEHAKSNFAILCFTGKEINAAIKSNVIIRLSPEGKMEEAARNLFSALRQLDRMQVDCILAEQFPDVELGKAINDRLKRASVQD